jgi:hypothetical protein
MLAVLLFCLKLLVILSCFLFFLFFLVKLLSIGAVDITLLSIFRILFFIFILVDLLHFAVFKSFYADVVAGVVLLNPLIFFCLRKLVLLLLCLLLHSILNISLGVVDCRFGGSYRVGQ